MHVRLARKWEMEKDMGLKMVVEARKKMEQGREGAMCDEQDERRWVLDD